MATEDTYRLVSTHYTAHLHSQPKDSIYNTAVASSFGYTADQLASIPASANIGVSCGNPLATANLKEGEIMIDLGCGAGLDVFIASSLVGPTGRVIGIDMTDSMLELAEKNKLKGGYQNTEFVKGNITNLPLPAETADIVTSNCVINLVPAEEKECVFAEIFRCLKPGGRSAISDILAKKELPEEVRMDVGLYVGCVAGATRTEEYERWIRAAGFRDFVVLDTKKDVNVYKEGILSLSVEKNSSSGRCCKPKMAELSGCTDISSVSPDEGRKERLEKLDLNDYVGAYQIYAIKPTS